MNPGLASRFTERLEFPNWSAADCVAAMAAKAELKGVALPPLTQARLESGLTVIRKQKGWANARDAVTCYDMLYKARSKRTVKSPEEAPSFTEDDAQRAVDDLGRSRGLSGGVPTSTAGAARAVAADAVRAARPVASGGGVRSVVDPEMYDDYELDDDESSSSSSEEEEEEEDTRPSGKRGVPPRPPIGPGGRFGGLGGGMGGSMGAPPPPAPTFKTREQTCAAAAEPEPDGGDGDGPSLEAAFGDLNYDLEQMLMVCEKAEIPAEVQQLGEQQCSWEPTEVATALRAQCMQLLPGLRELKKEQERQKSAEEARIQEKLKVVGKCPMGFDWLKREGGWVCAGGSHFVTDAQLMEQFGSEVDAPAK